jgi:outer membrane protein assembly factor BamB
VAAAACWLSVAVLLAACSATAGGPVRPSASSPATGSFSPGTGQPSAQAAAPGQWITYNGGNGRQGVATVGSGAPGAPSGSASSGSSATAPSIAWRARLDGAVYGQPLLVGGNVLAATENDSVYALDQAHGRVLWRTRLGTPQPSSSLACGDVSPLGVTSTMAYDPASGSLFALAETDGGHHTLFALDPATGTVRWQRAVEPPEGTPIDTQQRSALTVAFGRVYVPFGGLFGDCGDYVGSIVGVPANGQGTQVRYAVPTARKGGIWAPGGLLTVGTTLYASIGNGASTTNFDGSDSIVALNPELSRVGYFSPSEWQQDNATDLDLGSMTPAYVGVRIVALGKRGTAYVLSADHLGGVGGQIAQAQVCPAFGTAAVRGTTVYVPCQDGVRALEVASDSIKVVWKSTVSANGSPTLSGNTVWTVEYPRGTLYRLDARTGGATAQVALGTVPHFASPTLGADRVYVGTVAGVTAVTE